MREAERKQYNRQNEWQKANYDRYGFIMPKEYKELILKAAARNNESVSAFIKNAVIKALEETEKGADDNRLENKYLKSKAQAIDLYIEDLKRAEREFKSRIEEMEEMKARLTGE